MVRKGVLASVAPCLAYAARKGLGNLPVYMRYPIPYTPLFCTSRRILAQPASSTACSTSPTLHNTEQHLPQTPPPARDSPIISTSKLGLGEGILEPKGGGWEVPGLFGSCGWEAS